MSETSPASRQVMLLILITGLFVAAWSADSGHTAATGMQPNSGSRSAIAILMQANAAEPPADAAFDAELGDGAEIGCQRSVTHFRLAATTWTATTVCGTGDFRSPLGLDEPVAAPLPGQPGLPATLSEPSIDAPVPVAVDDSVEAPIPLVEAEPVVATVPPLAVPPLVERQERMPVLSLAAWRVIKIDYRMTCHCCRDYCGTAARKVAALERRSRQTCSGWVQTVARAVNGIDWRTRLSSEPAEGSQRRY